jgi:hypothetical protein
MAMMRSDRDEGMGIPSNDESIVIGSSSWHHDHDLFGGRKKGRAVFAHFCDVLRSIWKKESSVRQPVTDHTKYCPQPRNLKNDEGLPWNKRNGLQVQEFVQQKDTI